MWLLSMNQRHCGSALPYFLLCFLEHPGVAQSQQAQRGWSLGLHHSFCPPGEGDQGWAALGGRNTPKKEGFEKEQEWGKLVGQMGRKRCHQKVLGSCGPPPSCGCKGSGQGAAAAPCPSTCPLSWPTAGVQLSCLTPVALPLLLTITLVFTNLMRITAKGKIGRA